MGGGRVTRLLRHPGPHQRSPHTHRGAGASLGANGAEQFGRRAGTPRGDLDPRRFHGAHRLVTTDAVEKAHGFVRPSVGEAGG